MIRISISFLSGKAVDSAGNFDSDIVRGSAEIIGSNVIMTLDSSIDDAVKS